MNRNESGDSADSDETKKLKKEVDGLKSKLVEARKGGTSCLLRLWCMYHIT